MPIIKVPIGELVKVCSSYYHVGCEHCPFYDYNCTKYIKIINGKTYLDIEVTLTK